MPIDFELSEEQTQYVALARKVLDRFAPRERQIREAILRDQRFPEELWQAFAEAGFLGALVPEQYGGSGAGLLALVLALEEIGARGIACALLVVTAMDTACLVRHGSEAQKRRLLPEIAAGRMKLCFALTEPTAGSNTFRITSRARRTPDGAHYRLDGEKTFITGADVADRMLVVARTTSADECRERGLPKAYGLSLLLVDPRTDGITLSPLPTRGIEGFRQFTVRFDGALVPADALLGEEDAGAAALFGSLNPERVTAAAVCVGLSRYLVARSVAYANERRVFGDRPIGAYQGIAHPLAEVQIEIEATRQLVYRAAWAFDRGREPAETGYLANCAKFKAAELVVAAADRAIETHGGSGFSEEVGIIWYWDSARLLRTAPVTREMILNFVAEHALGLPRSY